MARLPVLRLGVGHALALRSEDSASRPNYLDLKWDCARKNPLARSGIRSTRGFWAALSEGTGKRKPASGDERLFHLIISPARRFASRFVLIALHCSPGPVF